MTPVVPLPTTGLPDWLIYVQAVGPTLIALAVAYVAFRQWRTAEANRKIANDKLVLDLFDKRFAWYSEVRRHLFEPLKFDSQPSRDAYLAFHRLTDEAHFLFGPEVQQRLAPLADGALGLSFTLEANPESEARARERKEKLDKYTPLALALHQDLPKLMAPYMKMDQKR